MLKNCVVSIILCLAVGFAAVSAGPTLSAASNSVVSFPLEDELCLKDGEAVVRVVEWNGDLQKRVQAAIIIPAPVDTVWPMMVDCSRALQFVPGLEACEVVNRLDGADIIRHKVHWSWLFPETNYVFKASYQHKRRINFSLVSGELNAMEGFWLLEPSADANETRVVYSVYLDPGFFVPGWMVRGMLQNDLPGLLMALRDYVLKESSK